MTDDTDRSVRFRNGERHDVGGFIVDEGAETGVLSFYDDVDLVCQLDVLGDTEYERERLVEWLHNLLTQALDADQ